MFLDFDDDRHSTWQPEAKKVVEGSARGHTRRRDRTSAAYRAREDGHERAVDLAAAARDRRRGDVDGDGVVAATSSARFADRSRDSSEDDADALHWHSYDRVRVANADP